MNVELNTSIALSNDRVGEPEGIASRSTLNPVETFPPVDPDFPSAVVDSIGGMHLDFKSRGFTQQSIAFAMSHGRRTQSVEQQERKVERTRHVSAVVTSMSSSSSSSTPQSSTPQSSTPQSSASTSSSASVSLSTLSSRKERKEVKEGKEAKAIQSTRQSPIMDRIADEQARLLRVEVKRKEMMIKKKAIESDAKKNGTGASLHVYAPPAPRTTIYGLGSLRTIPPPPAGDE